MLRIASLVRLRSCFGAVAHQLELLGDGRACPCVDALRDHAGDLAGARGGAFERLVEQGGEALQPLLEVLGADVERRDQRVRAWRGARRPMSSVLRLLMSISSTASASARPCAVELRGKLAEVVEHLGGDAAGTRSMCCVDLVAGEPVRVGDLVHRDEFGDARRPACSRARSCSRARRSALPAAGCWLRAAARTAWWCRRAACCASRASPRRAAAVVLCDCLDRVVRACPAAYCSVVVDRARSRFRSPR